MGKVLIRAVTNLRAIIDKLTSLGINTAPDASVDQIATNIDDLATNKYNMGYNAGKQVQKKIVSVTVSGISLPRVGNTDYHEADVAIRPGYALFKTCFPLVFSANHWTSNSSVAASVVYGAHNYTWTQPSSTLLHVRAYHVTGINVVIYYCDNP